MQDREVGDVLRWVARTSAAPSQDLNRMNLIEGVSEVARMRLVPQDPRWHPEGDVLTHSLLAVDAAAKLSDAESGGNHRREIVVLAALLHDIGKPATTRVEGGSVISPGHAELGEQVVLSMGERLSWPVDVSRAVAGIVRHHMAPVFVEGGPTKKAVNRLRSRLARAGTSLEEWAIVVTADGAARGSASIASRGAPWLQVWAGIA